MSQAVPIWVNSVAAYLSIYFTDEQQQHDDDASAVLPMSAVDNTREHLLLEQDAQRNGYPGLALPPQISISVQTDRQTERQRETLHIRVQHKYQHIQRTTDTSRLDCK